MERDKAIRRHPKERAWAGEGPAGAAQGVAEGTGLG